MRLIQFLSNFLSDNINTLNIDADNNLNH